MAPALCIQAFSCPKAGNRPEEYEDAWAVREGGAGVARVAVSDGATESSFSGPWAALLARRWARGAEVGPEFVRRLDGVRRIWSRRVAKRRLPWYAAEKAAKGAFAAFVGVEIDAARASWRALAVGDCCVLQVKGIGPAARLVQAFPLTSSAEFGSSPFLLGSVAARGDELSAHVRLAEGPLEGDDSLLLASDALSAWLLRCAEEGQPAWEAASALGVGDAAEFEALVAGARACGARNDDMTLVRVIPLAD